MRDPQELFQFETDTESGAGRPAGRTMVVSLGGLIDAGQTQKLMTSHLLGTLEHSVVASFDVDVLLDYRSRRPLMTFDSDHFSSYDDPSMLLYQMLDAEGTPFYLLSGPEPDFQWERVSAAVEALVRRLGVELVVSASGIPMGVPHTRPVGMTRFASDTGLIPENTPVFGMVQVPSSMENLMHLRLAEAGIDTVGFAVHVPHYLTQSEFGDAAVAALEAVCGVTGLDIPADDLVAMAGDNRAEIERQVAESGEATQVVQGLEQQYDAFQEGLRRKNLLKTEMAQLPSADEIGAEFEKFLRDEGGPDTDPAGPTD